MAVRTALVFLGTVDASSVAFAALEGARLATLLVVFGTFNAVTDPFGVVRLAPRRFHEPALAAALALSIAPRTIAMVGRVREAQRMRGHAHRPLANPPRARRPRVGDRDGGGRDARREHGRAGPRPRTTDALPSGTVDHGRGGHDRVRAVVAAGVFVAAACTGRGGLHPSTFPLTWPGADPVLIATISLLAVPGFLPAAEGRRMSR